MTTERWQAIKNVFQSVLGHEPEQRATLLDRACLGDEEMRGKVEAMLQAHEQAGSFIQAPAMELAAELMAEVQRETMSQLILGEARLLVNADAPVFDDPQSPRERTTRQGRSQNTNELIKFACTGPGRGTEHCYAGVLTRQEP